MSVVSDRQKKWDLRFLKLAREISTWSKDPNTKVGAVLADDNQVVSLGYNGFPKRIEDDSRLKDRDHKNRIIVHAEMNALLRANRDVSGLTLYTYPFMPCHMCAPHIINSGIARVVTLPYVSGKWLESFGRSMENLGEAGVLVEFYEELLTT